MAPRLVNEILAGMTCRHDLGSTFAARHHVMPAGRNLTLTEDARLGHKKFAGSIPNQSHIENGGRSGDRTRDRVNLQLGRPPGPFKAVSSSMPDFFHQWRRERDSHSRWGEPSRWQSARTFPGKLLVYPDSLHNISKMVRAPGNAPGPGTHLVRLRL